MNIDQISILFIVLITFMLFIWGKWRYDIVSIIALCTLFILDLLLGGDESMLVIDASNLFLGFGHPAVITVAAVLIISQALKNSGVVDYISTKIAPYSKNQFTHYELLKRNKEPNIGNSI